MKYRVKLRSGKKQVLVTIISVCQVAWVHYCSKRTAVLTVGSHVLTTNRRISVQVERDSYTLIIGNTTVKDRGQVYMGKNVTVQTCFHLFTLYFQYMCQISTVPPSKLFGSLHVLGKK